MAFMTVITGSSTRAYQLAAEFRKRGKPVVLGGPHVTLVPDEAEMHADSLVIGDADGQWTTVVEDARKGALKKRYANGFAANRHDGTRFDRSVFDGKKYAPVHLVQVGSGCRFACIERTSARIRRKRASSSMLICASACLTSVVS